MSFGPKNALKEWKNKIHILIGLYFQRSKHQVLLNTKVISTITTILLERLVF